MLGKDPKLQHVIDNSTIKETLNEQVADKDQFLKRMFDQYVSKSKFPEIRFTFHDFLTIPFTNTYPEILRDVIYYMSFFFLDDPDTLTRKQHLERPVQSKQKRKTTKYETAVKSAHSSTHARSTSRGSNKSRRSSDQEADDV